MIERLKLSGIYAILNILNEKVYIGSAIHFYQRWRDHKLALNTNKHRNVLLQRSWNKHGSDNFIFVVLELVENKSILLERETYWIQQLNSYNPELGYNILKIAGNRYGMKNSVNHNEKISNALKGIVRSEETKAKISTSKTGHLVSEETRIKIGLSGVGRKAHNKGKGIIFSCIDGVKCKCEKCKEIRKTYNRNYAQKQIGISVKNNWSTKWPV